MRKERAQRLTKRVENGKEETRLRHMFEGSSSSSLDQGKTTRRDRGRKARKTNVHIDLREAIVVAHLVDVSIGAQGGKAHIHTIDVGMTMRGKAEEGVVGRILDQAIPVRKNRQGVIGDIISEWGDVKFCMPSEGTAT